MLGVSYGAAVSVGGSSMLRARYLLATLPAYWLLVVQLADRGGRLGKGLLIGIVLPWVLISIGLTLEKGIVPSQARQSTLLVTREARNSETDLILCDRYMPLGWQAWWEWTRRLGHRDGVEILPSHVAPWLKADFPGKDLDQLDLRHTERVWLFYSGRGRTIPVVKEFLTSRGFVQDERPLEPPTRVVLFRRLSLTRPGSSS